MQGNTMAETHARNAAAGTGTWALALPAETALGAISPIILDLPTLSVDGFGRYLRRLLTVGKDPNAIVTRFALKKAINKAGITYSQVTFTEGRDLLPEELTAVRRLAAQVQAYSSSGDFDADDADAANVDAIPDYDPETGEILSSDPQVF